MCSGITVEALHHAVWFDAMCWFVAPPGKPGEEKPPLVKEEDLEKAKEVAASAAEKAASAALSAAERAKQAFEAAIGEQSAEQEPEIKVVMRSMVVCMRRLNNSVGP